MSKRKIGVIAAPADRDKAQPVLDALKSRGFRLADEKDGSAAALLFLSEAFAADEEAQSRFFALDSAGRTIIPVDLDGAAQSELVRSALIAKNAIAASGRTAEEIAERVASAEAFREKKSPLPKILIAAAAVLILGAAVWLWRGSSREEPGAETAPQEDAIALARERFGLSEEDLGRIGGVLLLGDKLYYATTEQYLQTHRYPEWDDYASAVWTDGGQTFYSLEDGSEIKPARYDDLGVLALMPSLTKLTLVDVEAENIPSLAGLKWLENVQIYNCRIGECEWLSGSNIVSFALGTSDVSDFTPLSSCEKLTSAALDLQDSGNCDLSGFAPPALKYLNLFSSTNDGLDLSALRACGSLRTVELSGLPIEDLDFLSGSKDIIELKLSYLSRLRDVSAIGEMKGLKRLSIQSCASLRDISALGNVSSALGFLEITDCGSLADFTPISACTGLKTVTLGELPNLRDASFLAPLGWLRSICITDCALRDLNFLNSFEGVTRMVLEIRNCASLTDWSGLAAVQSFDSLNIGFLTNGRRGSMERVYPALEGLQVNKLYVCDCAGLDLSRLPEQVGELQLRNCDLEDLRGMPAWNLKCLTLSNMERLTSLEGLENLVTLGKAKALGLQIVDCPRLSDWSALDNAFLGWFELEYQYNLPDMGNIKASKLKLRGIPGMTDLHLLDDVQNTSRYGEIRLEELSELRDISSLGRLRIVKLIVPPQVAEQAEELVEKGGVETLEIAYPEGSWELGEFELLSLEELETLPKALLRHVTRLCIAGDRLMNDNVEYWCYEGWDEDGRAIPMLHLADEEIEMNRGTISELSFLADLTGLEELVLWNQPLESLEGIQAFTGLRRVELKYCEELRDVSAVFTLQELEDLSLRCSGAESIRGVQNLTELRRLEIAFTDVTDISPLAESRFDAAARCGEGFRLQLDGLNIGDYSPLGAIEYYSELNFDGSAEAARWAEALKDAKIDRLQFFHSDFDNESFARFVLAHPELRTLWIPWNENITDLTALLALPMLETVDVSYSMEEAVSSLEGKAYNFELIVEHPD